MADFRRLRQRSYRGRVSASRHRIGGRVPGISNTWRCRHDFISTLLARWADADPRPFAWVVLDARDSDAVVFLRYIAAAIHRVEPVLARGVRRVVRPERVHLGERVPRVGAALAALERPLVLALDDLHLVANPSCLDVLAELVQYVPAGSQIAVASREEPALPLARWRTNGQASRDRRGGPPARRAGGRVAAGSCRSRARCERALRPDRADGRLARGPVPRGAVDADGGAGSLGGEGFNGDDRFVSEYFRGELLSRLPAAEATFLKHTSVLERLSGGLCDAVLETTGSAQTLDALERANGFVVRLDRRREWYRYHHLFGQLLRNELERSEPDVVAELNRRAMAWCIANDLPEEAIVYGQAAGDDGHRCGPGRRSRSAGLLRRPSGDRRGVARLVR